MNRKEIFTDQNHPKIDRGNEEMSLTNLTTLLHACVGSILILLHQMMKTLEQEVTKINAIKIPPNHNVL